MNFLLASSSAGSIWALKVGGSLREMLTVDLERLWTNDRSSCQIHRQLCFYGLLLSHQCYHSLRVGNHPHLFELLLEKPVKRSYLCCRQIGEVLPVCCRNRLGLMTFELGSFSICSKLYLSSHGSGS